MDEDGMEEEIIETDEYSLDLEIRLEELRVLRQTTTSTRQPVQSNEQIPEIAGEREYRPLPTNNDRSTEST